METLKRARRELHHAIVRALLRGVGVLPRPVAVELFALVGVVGYATLGRERRRVERHLSLAFPDLDRRARRRLVRRVFMELGRNAADVFRALGHATVRCSRLVESVEGEAHLARALAGGRGAVVVTGHFGAWELLAGYFAEQGHRVRVLARPLRDPRYQRLVTELRRRLGVDVVQEGESLRALIRAVRGGELAGILIDQNRTGRGVWIELLGRPAWTPIGAAELARLADVPLLPMAIRRSGRRHRITIGEPIVIDREHPEPAVVATRACVGVLEGWIRDAPDQWVWMYDRRRGPRGRSGPGAREGASPAGSRRPPAGGRPARGVEATGSGR